MVYSGCTCQVSPGETFRSAIVFHRTISRRFYRWRTASSWQKIWSSLMQQADVDRENDWGVHFIDGTVVRAHQHAAGALVESPPTSPKLKLLLYEY